MPSIRGRRNSPSRHEKKAPAGCQRDQRGQTRGMSQVSQTAKCGSNLRVHYAWYIRTFGHVNASSVYNPRRVKSDSGRRNAVDNLGTRAAHRASAIVTSMMSPFRGHQSHGRLLHMPSLSSRTLACYLWAALVVAAWVRPGAALAQPVADLELVIAVDVSLSMDLETSSDCSAMATSPPSGIRRCTRPSPRARTAALP